MDEIERRDAIKESNRRRARDCGGCGSSLIKEVDGSEIGGMPGIVYKHCAGCGWSQARTKKQRKFKL